jgi:RNA polymerase sigma-70 factor (ECF subfamily)
MEQEPIVDVAARTGMSISAVQAWSSRLKRRIAGILAELSVDVAPPGPSARS